jgi:replicative DNA helicase
MKLIAVNVEKKVIKTIARSGKISEFLLARVKEEDFYYPPSKEVYKRIQTIMVNRGVVLNWEQILSDPVISEDTRNIFSSYKEKPNTKITRAKKSIDILKKYTKIRKAYYLAEDIIKQVKKDSIDVDELIDSLSDRVQDIRISGNNEAIIRIGKKLNRNLIQKLKDGTDTVFFPTGIQQYDKENIGLPRGGLFIPAGTSGGGKTVLLLQIALFQALFGLRVCVVNLEMSKEEVINRLIANFADVSMSNLNKAGSNKVTQELIEKSFIRMNKKISRNGGELGILCPEEDVDIQELLYSLKPYAYDAIYIDYIGLLAGTDGDDQPKQLSRVARFSKRFASINKCLIGLAAQLDEEKNVIRYSRAITEHASNSWIWNFDEQARKTGVVKMRQRKARNQREFDLFLKANFDRMRFEHAQESDLPKKEVSDKKGFTSDLEK